MNAPADLSKAARALLAAAVDVLEPVDRCRLAFALLIELGANHRSLAAEMLAGRPPAGEPIPTGLLGELTIACTAIATLIANGLELGVTPAVPLLRTAGSILEALRRRGWVAPAEKLHVCVVCNREITEGTMVGAGDGTGQRFRHRDCPPGLREDIEQRGWPAVVRAAQAAADLRAFEGAIPPALVRDAQARVNRLLRKWTVGEKAIAVMPIFYAAHDLEIPMSTVGIVANISTAGVLQIQWTGRLGWLEAVATSPDSVDPWEAP